jgi:hypothetical protein
MVMKKNKYPVTIEEFEKAFDRLAKELDQKAKEAREAKKKEVK